MGMFFVSVDPKLAVPGEHSRIFINLK